MEQAAIRRDDRSQDGGARQRRAPGLIAALKTFSPKGSKVLLQTPTYNGFYSDLTASETKAEESPLKFVNGKFQMDFDDFERRISYDTHTFILCNPQNPTGNCWSAEDLLRIGEICLKHRVIVLADEIHCDWVSKGQKYTPFASLQNKAVVDNSLTFKAASKSFGLAAHKTAWYYSTNPELLARIRPNHRADLNTLGIVANYGAITDGEEWLRQANEYVSATHDFVVNFVGDKIPLDQGPSRGRHLPHVARCERRRRAHRVEEAGGGLQPHQAGQHAGADAGADGRALLREDREGAPQPGRVVRQGRREPHAHEHRHVAQAGRARVEQHGHACKNSTSTNLNMLF